MNAVYRGRRMPAAWSPPGGVVTAQVDRRTGMAVDASCPGSGSLYTEYFIHRMPPAQTCYPTAAYPAMVMGDTAWHDDEAGAWSYMDTVGTTDLQRRGIDWPELEEKRRREAAGAAPRTPLPGNVEDPYGTAPRRRRHPSSRRPRRRGWDRRPRSPRWRATGGAATATAGAPAAAGDRPAGGRRAPAGARRRPR